MTAVILLSSSPPRVFARSPTPADSSSPLPSTAALIHGHSPGRRKFKAKVNPRDGVSTSFSTARQVLAEKGGAENAIIASSGRNKFKSSQGDSVEDVIDQFSTSEQPNRLCTDPASVTGAAVQARPTEQASILDKAEKLEAKTQPKGDKRRNVVSSEPLLLERAAARKLDWTPPTRKSQRQDEERPVEYSAGYMNGMLSDFTYANVDKTVSAPQHGVSYNPAKRRRVNPDNKSNTKSGVIGLPEVAKVTSAPAKTAPKRNRSPTKKTLTITGLATSNYFGDDGMKETPMMQYLTSTQAQLNNTLANSALETKVQKTKAAAKKTKDTKKNRSKSLLLSPKSAMRTVNEQEAIFGSASQLARDDSPTLLRETIQAIKQSESFLWSDPLSSPQLTQPVSVENTPQAGTSKFRKTRNLWAAAGRDEDNALLHVDTVDLSDTPAVRAAFAGKDVMLQPGTKHAVSTDKSDTCLRVGYSPLRLKHKSAVIDVVDIAQSRAFSSAVNVTSPRKSPSRTLTDSKTKTSPKKSDLAMLREPPPPKPNYAGFITRDLNKQITSYGFKAMKKREKMIELLDRCWEEKYGPSEDCVDAESEGVPFGDFLSKVHDISARPEPKVKKARVRKKKEEVDQKSMEKPARKPRQRKKKEPEKENEEDVPVKPKSTRKRKAKTAAINEDSVLDIDNIWNTIPEELRSIEAFEDWAKPEKRAKSKVNSEPAVVTMQELRCPPTPPATLPLHTEPIPLPASKEASLLSEANPQPDNFTTTPAPTPSPTSIPSQITAAIMHQSCSLQPGRNHNTNPTWHEKILLYDPIILEDLAMWLNTEGLGSIGEDREVSAMDVREWCETQGICCLWRGGWRGNKLAQ